MKRSGNNSRFAVYFYGSFNSITDKFNIHEGAGTAFQQGIAKIGAGIPVMLIFGFVFLVLTAFTAAFCLFRVNK